MTEVSGDGDADLEPDGTLTGEIRFHHVDRRGIGTQLVGDRLPNGTH
jgi:hypothetical protein